MSADDFQVHLPELEVINGYIEGEMFEGKLEGQSLKMKGFYVNF